MDKLHIAANHSATEYDEQNTNRQQLSLLVKGHQIYVSVSDSSEKLLLHLEKWTLDNSEDADGLSRQALDGVFRLCPLLQKPFGQIHLAFWTPYFTFVPQPFSNDNESSFLKWQLNGDLNWNIKHASLPKIDGQLYYAISGAVESWAHNHFETARISHAIHPLVSYLSELNTNNGRAKVYAYVTDRQLEIVVFDHNRFHLYNTYRYEAAEDFLYFVTLAFQQLGLDPDKDVLILAGEISKDGQLFALAYRYFRNIEFSTFPKGIELANGLDEINNHHYLHLMTLI